MFLLSRLTAQRLVVLATYRTDDLHRRHPLRPVLSELVRLPAVERLELAPLDAADSLDLVRRLADGTLSEPLLRRVAERSEGNAFFAEELVSASSDGLPHGLAEVLMARIEGLPPATQQVLRLAAVAGRRVEHELLAAVSELPDDELEQALRDAVTHHVLVDRHRQAAMPTCSGTRCCARRSTPSCCPASAAGCTPATPQLIAEQGAEAGAAAELAHHAVAAHDLPLALAASVRAAREADRRAAPAEVLLHTERALELWDAVPDAERVSGMTEIAAHHLGGVDGQRQRRSRSGHRARPPRARSRRAGRRSGAHGHA